MIEAKCFHPDEQTLIAPASSPHSHSLQNASSTPFLCLQVFTGHLAAAGTKAGTLWRHESKLLESV